jgi:predicted nuclease with TOPRIM domain
MDCTTDLRMIEMETAKVGLVVSVVLVAALAVSNVWLYTTLQDEIQTLRTEQNTLQSQVNTLHEQKNALNATYQEYKSTHSHSNSKYDALEAERDLLKAPKLSTLSLHSMDERPELGTPRLRIYGEVWNVGNDIAYDCRLDVVAHQGTVKAIDTQIFVGTIFGENGKSIDDEIHYSGEALTSWSITASWG